MLRIFKHTYRDGNGKRHESENYHVAFTDRDGKEWTLAAFADRSVTESFAGKLQRLLACHVSGEAPDRELVVWLEKVPDRIRARLAKLGLLDPRRAAAGKPLTDHLAEFEAALGAKGQTGMYVKTTAARVRAILDGCHFTKWSDIAPGKVEAYLAEQRKPGGEDDPGMSIRTCNGYIGAFKQFCKWMVSERRASESPVAFVKRMNAQTDRRIVRRALTVEECRKLLDAARKGKPYAGLTGADRDMLYRLALESGLRWNELRTLTAGSFALDATTPTVTVKAGYSKHRREDTLPLRPETTELLRDYLATKLPAAQAFPMPDRNVGGSMVEEDLAVAGIEAKDAAGRVVDFHALRHTFITNLCNGGVHPKTAQSLARHSSIVLTMDHYTHLTLASQTNALDALPDLDASPAETLRATGTDDISTVPETVPEKVVKSGSFGKELEGSNASSRSHADGVNPLPALEKANASGMMRTSSEGGGIGRRAGLRIQRSNPCGFKSRPSHQGRISAYDSALGAMTGPLSSAAAGSLTRQATNSETTHKAIPASVNVGR